MRPRLGEGVDEERLRQPAVALVAAYGEPVDVPRRAVVGDQDQRDAHDRGVGVEGDPEVPRLEARPAGRRGLEVLEALAVAHRPLEERVLQHVVGGAQLAGLGRPDDVAVRQVALRDRRARGELEHPAGPPHAEAEVLQQPVAGRALRHRHPDDARADAAAEVLEPVRPARCRSRGRGGRGGRRCRRGRRPSARRTPPGSRRRRRRPSGRRGRGWACAQSLTMSASSMATSPMSSCSWAAISTKTACASDFCRGRVVRPAGRAGGCWSGMGKVCCLTWRAVARLSPVSEPAGECPIPP